MVTTRPTPAKSPKCKSVYFRIQAWIEIGNSSNSVCQQVFERRARPGTARPFPYPQNLMSSKDFHIHLILRRPPPFRLDKHTCMVQLIHGMVVRIVIDHICRCLTKVILFVIHAGLMRKGKKARSTAKDARLVHGSDKQSRRPSIDEERGANSLRMQMRLNVNTSLDQDFPRPEREGRVGEVENLGRWPCVRHSKLPHARGSDYY